ncbi:MAG: nucleotidyl transferase AbiEii/AbiGii toxin family protein [Thermoplasmata archaeon]
MISFIPMLAEHLGVEDQELLEKDVRLHSLLGALARDPQVGPHLVFKGGTCLIKCYLNYPRFSTDLDFTWVEASDVTRSRPGTKRFRKEIRPTQRGLEGWLREWADRQGYQIDKPEFVTFGRSNRMMTAKLSYPLRSTGEGFVKVQLNFAERLHYPPVHAEARSLLQGSLPAAFRLLKGNLATSYSTPIPVNAYDPREILLEKCRALLTRTAAKGRDLVDLFLLEETRELRVEGYSDGIVAKTREAVGGYARYRRQALGFEDRESLLLGEDLTPLLLKPLDMEGFQRYRERVLPFLRTLIPRVFSQEGRGRLS